MDVTVFKAKSQLSALLKRAEEGEEIIIRRGKNGSRFRLSLIKDASERNLDPVPGWANSVSYEDDAIWESEWVEEQ